MLVIYERFKVAIFFILTWIEFDLSQFPLSLREAPISLDSTFKFCEPFRSKSIAVAEGKRKNECHKWLMQTASTLCRDIPRLSVSVVIVSHNEKEHILVNTVKSLLANTSADLLKELIIVDDNSQPPIDLKSKSFEIQVIVIRNSARQGLIKSRLLGANQASGKFLIFADSHINFANYWLEPLVLRLISYEKFENPSGLMVLSPFINALMEDGQEYPAKDYLRGGFDWDLTFTWEPMSEEEKENLNTYGSQKNFTWLSLPRASPAIAGSVIAMIRRQFITYGTFDKQMKIWGGENIELSLRAWMCGGRVEIIPCSHVSHLFRSSHSYSFPEGKSASIVQNLKRVAMIWMQPSKNLTFDSAVVSVPPIALFYSYHQEALKISSGDLSSRLQLKRQFKCNDFFWFVENIYPDLKRKGNNVKLRDNALIIAKVLTLSPFGIFSEKSTRKNSL